MPITKKFYKEHEIKIAEFTSTYAKDFTGEQYGRLTVLGFSHSEKNSSKWYVKCTCGNITIVYGRSLKTGRTKSCGCLSAEFAKKTFSKHNSSFTPEYGAYRDAKQRCNNPNNANYKWYGKEGIEFKFNSFEEFYAEIGDRPTEKHSIDRIDNNGHYEAGNIRWTLKQNQSNNTRRSIILHFAGEDLSIAQWHQNFNVLDYAYVERRILSYNWCPICAIIEKPYTKKPQNCGHEKDYRLYKRYDN